MWILLGFYIEIVIGCIKARNDLLRVSRLNKDSGYIAIFYVDLYIPLSPLPSVGREASSE
jgi:hypothetical protein